MLWINPLRTKRSLSPQRRPLQPATTAHSLHGYPVRSAQLPIASSFRYPSVFFLGPKHPIGAARFSLSFLVVLVPHSLALALVGMARASAALQLDTIQRALQYAQNISDSSAETHTDSVKRIQQHSFGGNAAAADARPLLLKLASVARDKENLVG